MAGMPWMLATRKLQMKGDRYEWDRREREDVPDEDGNCHHPFSLFGRDRDHENLLFKKPIVRIRTFGHLDDKRVFLAPPSSSDGSSLILTERSSVPTISPCLDP